MSILRVISENVKAKYSNEGNAAERGRFLVGDKWYQCAWHSGEHFVEGQENIEGRIIEIESGGTDGRGNWVNSNRIGFEPDRKYTPPKYSYLFLENREVDFNILGNFVGDCTLCGEKHVVEYTHVMGDCPKKHKRKVKAIQKAQDDWHKTFKKKCKKDWDKRQKMLAKPRKKERRYQMTFTNTSGFVGLTGSFKNKKEALKEAKKEKAKVKSIKFLGWK